MNPFCPKCHRMMYKGWKKTESGKANILGKPVFGIQRVWRCRNCRRTYKMGAEVIRMKPQPEPRCFGKDEDKCLKCKKHCEHRNFSISEAQRRKAEETMKVTKKTKQSLNRRPSSKVVKKDAKKV